MFTFSVPDGDFDYDSETRTYIFRNLVFTEKSWKKAKAAIKEFVNDGTPFTMIYQGKDRKCS